MIRALIRIAIAGIGTGWLVDRWLAGRPDAAPLSIVSTVDIAVPPEVVWQAIADIERQPDWMHDLKRVEIVSAGPIGVGTRAIGTVRILGISVKDPAVITEFEPPVRYAIEHEGLFGGSGVIELSAVGAGPPWSTHVRWTETLVPPVLPHLASVIQRPILGAVFQADLDRLKAQVEARGLRTATTAATDSA